MFPPGPMDVWNIRLKGMGGERSFPVVGDLTLYFTKRSVSSCWVKLSICSHIKDSAEVNQIGKNSSDSFPNNFGASKTYIKLLFICVCL